MKKKKKKKKVVLLLTSKAESFDYYKLALQWTPGFCHGKKKCRVPISQFMVYGLYNNFTTTQPDTALETSMHSH
ncbi:hypothetical protein LINPERHAP2_LOCUS25355 [Linum perenne]